MIVIITRIAAGKMVVFIEFSRARQDHFNGALYNDLSSIMSLETRRTRVAWKSTSIVGRAISDCVRDLAYCGPSTCALNEIYMFFNAKIRQYADALMHLQRSRSLNSGIACPNRLPGNSHGK